MRRERKPSRIRQYITIIFFLAAFYAQAQWNTNSPSTTTSTVSIGKSTSAGSMLDIQHSLGSDALRILDQSGQTRLSIGQESGYTGNYIHSQNIDLKFKTQYNAGSGGNIIFYTGNTLTERLRISNSGNVGIGYTTPQKTLDVNPGVNSYVSFGAPLAANSSEFSGLHFGYLEPNNSNYRKSALVFERLDEHARGKIHLLNNGAGSAASASLADAKMTIDFNGNIGIGNALPGDRLDIGGDDKLNIRVGRWASLGIIGSHLATVLGNNVRASTTANNMEIMTTTVDGAKAIKMQYNEGITFHTLSGSVTGGNVFSSERMRVDNNGNVGIGVIPSVDNRLQVRGRVVAENEGLYATGDKGSIVMAAHTGYYNKPSLHALTSGGITNDLLINPGGGNVGIGTSTPDQKLTVDGTVRCEEVRVELIAGSGPDYVFEPDYDLKPLSEVESYIKATNICRKFHQQKKWKRRG